MVFLLALFWVGLLLFVVVCGLKVLYYAFRCAVLLLAVLLELAGTAAEAWDRRR